MRSNWFWALVILAVSVWGLAGCAAHAQAPDVETVGQLAAGPSVYSAPLKHDEPPQMGFVAGSSDDAPGEVVTTEVRADASADAGGADAEAPDVEAKGGGLVVGGVR